jgi:hypothetical protein
MDLALYFLAILATLMAFSMVIAWLVGRWLG